LIELYAHGRTDLRSKKLIVIIIAVIITGVIAAYYYARTPFEQQKPVVNAIAPEIQLADLTGTMQSLSDYRDQVILINFWASWCPPCKEQLRLFQKFFDTYEEKGFTVFAIALDDVSPDEVRKMLISYPVFITNERVTNDYGNIKGVPRTFLIGKNGKIRQKTKEYYNEDSLRHDIEAALE
jgi:cytochrome c biogenesis protein CcmG/thiol:disulfide interchange protein DsbE